MVLAVLGQQVLADPAEGEVPVVKALEVGLSCDETLSWGDRGRGGGGGEQETGREKRTLEAKKEKEHRQKGKQLIINAKIKM